MPLDILVTSEDKVRHAAIPSYFFAHRPTIAEWIQAEAFHGTLLLDEGVEIVVIKELLGHAHIGVTATAYAHIRMRIQRPALDRLTTALNDPAERHEVDERPNSGILVG